MTCRTSDLGGVLRAERLKAQLSQERLGALAGVSGRTVNRIESGVVAPTVPTLQALATALGVTVGYLIGEETDQ